MQENIKRGTIAENIAPRQILTDQNHSAETIEGWIIILMRYCIQTKPEAVWFTHENFQA